MANIRFGSQVYTWFMQGTGKAYDNKLDHMIKVAAEAGFQSIEPMVLEISASALQRIPRPTSTGTVKRKPTTASVQPTRTDSRWATPVDRSISTRV